jgi:hypothetical protein
MNDEHSHIRTLKQRWDEEDAARDKQEERAQQIFLEEEANQTFAPIENYFTRLSKVLSAVGASVEIDTTWQRRSKAPSGGEGNLLKPPAATVARFHHSRSEYFLPQQAV